MTPRERWLAAMRSQPVDHLLFWPKITEAFSRAHEARFGRLARAEWHDWIGSARHPWVPGWAKEVHTWMPSYTREVRKKTSVEVRTDADGRRTIFNTRFGSTELIERFDVHSQSFHPIKYPVENLGNIRVMIEFYSDCTLEVDKDTCQKGRSQQKEIGFSAATKALVGESAMMYWVEYLAGVENAHYLLTDYQHEVEELFETIHRLLLRKLDIMCNICPTDCLYYQENTSTTLISPTQFRKFCFRHLQEYAQMARDAGRLLVLHMCGHLKALLPDLSTLPVPAFEAFTFPPLGNTRLVDGRIACPNKCLIGGTNAVLWTQTAKEIISEIEQDLGTLPHHRGIILSSAGVMTPLCKPEIIKTVCDWIKGYVPRA